MKKLFVLAAAILVMGSVFAQEGDKKCAKGKDCCKKESMAKAKEKDKECCKKDSKEAKTIAKETKSTAPVKKA